MKRLIGSIVFIISLSFCITSCSEAQDETTSACDGLSGEASGLCYAYCEAMDCDTEEGYLQYQNACDKVLEDFKIKTNESAQMPCDCIANCPEGDSECNNGCMDLLGVSPSDCVQICINETDFSRKRCENICKYCPDS